jgi:Tol biopolymer transport system component
MVGNPKPFPLVQTRFDERRGQFSPDGRWVAYESNDSGRFQIYVQPFPASGGKWQMSTAGGSQVRWRHDGKELFYLAPDQRLMAVPIAVAADGQTLTGGEPAALFMTHLAQGAAITGTRSQYAVAADGRFLMNVIVEETAPTPPITVIVNWAARLKK